MKHLRGLTVFFLLVLGSFGALATTFPVSNTNDSGAGSLREAITNANADGSATFASPHIIDATGITGTIILSSTITITNHIYIQFPAAKTLTISKVLGGFRLLSTSDPVYIQADNVIFLGLGEVFFEEGGIALDHIDSEGVFNNCDFVLNHMHNASGAGIYALGLVRINNCLFDQNSSLNGQGSGVFIACDAKGFISNSTFTNNDDAAVSSGGDLFITNTTFENNNNTGGAGGAIRSFSGELNIFNSYFTNNDCNPSFDAGVIFAFNTVKVRVFNSTFYQNEKDVFQNTTSSKLILTHCTFANNANALISDGSTGDVVMNQCISVGHTDDLSAVAYTVNSDFGHNIIRDLGGNTLAGVTTGNVTGATATYANLFGANIPADNGGASFTLALAGGSPALDAASMASIGEDQRGFLRSGTPDVGAYESGASGTFVVPTTPAEMVSVTNSGSDLQVAWNNGSGTNRIVVASEGQPVDVVPVHDTNYTASATFGSGDQLGGGENYVVYNGTGSNVTATGLNGATTYYFAVFEETGLKYTLDQLYDGDCSAVGNIDNGTTPVLPLGPFFSQNNGAFDNPINWANGGGTPPVAVNFTNGGSSFVIQNPHIITSGSSAINIDNFSINSGGIYQNSNQDITVTGNTSISGDFEYTTTSTTISTFTGTLTIESTGRMEVVSNRQTDLHFNGDIINKGTFNLASSAHWYIESPLSIQNQSATDMNFSQFASGLGFVNADLNLLDFAGGGNINLYSNISVAVAGGITITNNIGDYPTTSTRFLNMPELTSSGAATFESAANAITHYRPKSGTGTGITYNLSAPDNLFAYTTTSNQDVFPVTHHHLTVTDGGIKSLQGNTTVNGDLTINGTTALDASNFNIDLNGDWINNEGLAGFMAGSGIVSFNSLDMDPQIISGETNFNSLVINNTGSSREVTVNSPLSIASSLTLTSGVLNVTGGNILSVLSSATIGGTFGLNRMIQLAPTAIVRKHFDGDGSFIYPIGTLNIYNETTATLNVGTLYNGAAGTRYIDVSLIGMEEPNVLNSGLSLTKYWTVNSVNLDNITGSLVLNYDGFDAFNGDENNYLAASYDGTWNTTASVAPATNTVSFAFAGSTNLNANYTAGEIGAFNIIPSLSSTSPVANSIANSTGANIVLSFSENMSQNSVDGGSNTFPDDALDDNVQIYGDRTGRVRGIWSGDGTNTLTFNPSTDFDVGEVIYVTITDAVQSSTGVQLSGSEIFQFGTLSVSGPSIPDFFIEQVVSTGANGVFNVQIADIDGDGDLDMLSASNTDNKIAWYENNGASNPVFVEQGVSTSAIGARSVHVGDVDGDGDLDILSASAGDNKIVWYENDGATNPTFAEQGVSTSASNAESVNVGDMDGDGDLDILSASSVDNKIAWYENDGAANPTFSEQSVSTAATSARDVHVGDMDGDGDLDILSASSNDGKVAWYENDGAANPSFTERVITILNNGAINVHVGDIDGDGDLDILSASALVNEIAWYENDGASDPAFTEQVVSTSANGARGVHVADVDGDGDLDILSASAGDNKIAWYENDGAVNPVFTEQVVSIAAINAVSVHAGDMDGDGDLDILSASNGDDKISWYENTANEPSTQATNITFSNIGATQMDISWTNGDGSDRLVLVKAGNPVDTNPTDATNYTSNAIFGSGTQLGIGNYAIYNGTGSSMTMTGLTPGETYHIRVYEYNGTAGDENYNINAATGNPASQMINMANGLPPGLTAMYFDGMDDYVDVGDIDALDGVSQMSIEAWVKVEDFNSATNLGIVDKGTSGTTRFGMLIGGSGSSLPYQIRLNLENGSNAFGTTTSQPLLGRENIWVHIAMVFEGAGANNPDRLKLFINGVNEPLSFTGTIPTTTNINSAPVEIGKTILPEFFKGQIDEVKIFNVVRTQAEIQADIYTTDTNTSSLIGYWSFDDDLTAGNQTTAVDGSGNNNNGTLTNNPLWAHRVINTDDSGEGSLREAITRSNTDTDTDFIDFSIPGVGVQTITPGSVLPSISESVIINGYSQPGSSANTLAVGNDAILNIELDGSSAGGASGLSISATNSEVYGLIIHSFASNGIVFTGTGNTIAGCQVGLNALGIASQNTHGVRTNVSNNIIGLPTPAGRNTISGNRFNGIQVQGGADIANLTIQNNYLGTSPDGLTLIGGGTIRLIGSSSSLIGGTTPLERNVVGSGISMNGSASGGHQILGNYIGVGADGTTALGIPNGIVFQSDNLSNMQIGGLATGEANIIANTTNGILLTAGTASTGNSIRGNIMYGNTIGIDLGIAGADTNDVGDSDSGNNNLQNYPVLNSAIINGSAVEVSFNVDAIDGPSTYPLDIDFYISDGNRQGQSYIGSVSYTSGDAQNNVLASFTPLSTVNVSDLIVATATDANGNTSEFSAEFTLGAFVTTWNASDGTITIPTLAASGTYNYDIVWRNLTSPGTNEGSDTGQSGNYTIGGLTAGHVYQIEISGDFPHFYMNGNATEATKLLTVQQWGDIAWASMSLAFRGCSNLNGNISDVPNLSSVSHLSSMFRDATIFNQDISDWDVSNITRMNLMFRGASSYNNGNQPLDWANTGIVDDMEFMFTDAISFNQDISDWDVSNVIYMYNMFGGASSFNNGGLALDWNDTGNVIDMSLMFQNATAFNQDLSNWNVSNVTGMVSMFDLASTFNQDIGSWDVSSTNDMSNMLDNSGLSIANYDAILIGWDALPSLQSGVPLGAANLNYCSGETAKNNIIASYGWIITGDVLLCTPEIEVLAGTNPFTSGDTETLASAVQPSDATQTFTINNTGTADLTVSSLFSDGSSYSVSSITSPIVAGGSTTFTVTLDGSTANTFVDILTLTTNDADEGSFVINLSGIIMAPESEIEVLAGTNPFTSGDTETLASAVQPSDATQAFTINNTGTADLTIGSAFSDGSSYLVSSIASPIVAGGSTTFTVTLDGGTAGSFADVLTLTTNDADEGSFVINLSGTITATLEPDIEVRSNSAPITGVVEFLPSQQGDVVAVPFDILNNGTANLNVSDITSSNTAYTIANITLPNTIGASGVSTFDLELNTSDVGVFEATITITSDDPDQGNFVFDVRAVVEGAQVVIVITNPDNSVDRVIITNQDVDIGQTSLNQDIEKVFGIENLSASETITVNSITVDNSAFEVMDFTSTVPAGGFIEFTIILRANDAGQYSANVNVSTSINDFSFRIIGEVTSGDSPNLNIYNVITPNGDNVHDFFKIGNIIAYPDNQVIIYNRWGDKIFEINGYDNDANIFLGVSNVGSNQELDEGNYYYAIDKGNGSKKETGYLFLKR